jgi:hypothetical protein
VSTAKQKRNALARRIISSIETFLIELKDLEDDIRQLWVEFDHLSDGEKILGCSTKKQFCEEHLNRTPRAVRYMLDGGNHKRGETVSPMKDDPPFLGRDDDPSTDDLNFLRNFAKKIEEGKARAASGPATKYKPSAADIKEFVSLGRRAAANKYHTDRAGGNQEQMVRMNQVADWLLQSFVGVA